MTQLRYIVILLASVMALTAHAEQYRDDDSEPIQNTRSSREIHAVQVHDDDDSNSRRDDDDSQSRGDDQRDNQRVQNIRDDDDVTPPIRRSKTRASYDSRDRNESSFSIGPQIGYTNFGFTGSGAPVTQSVSGFTAGILADIGSGRLVFETGAMYIQEGSQGQMTATDSYGNSLPVGVNFSANYLAIPLLAKFKISDNGDSNFHVKAGLTPQILLNSGVKVSVYNLSGSADLSNNMNRFDTLATLGLGGDIAVSGSSVFTIDVMYERGLVDISRDGGAIYNQGLILTGGMLF